MNWLLAVNLLRRVPSRTSVPFSMIYSPSAIVPLREMGMKSMNLLAEEPLLIVIVLAHLPQEAVVTQISKTQTIFSHKQLRRL